MISIVIPALNEQKHLSKCLGSLIHQDYQGKFEIIVVDNGSTDDTATLAKSYGIKVVNEARTGIAWARQRGFQTAKGDIIVSTDADAILPSNWLSHINILFQQHPEAVAVAGHYLLVDGPITARLGIRLSLLLIPVIIKLYPKLWNFAGSNFAVKAQHFASIGGFDTVTTLADDIKLCQRLRQIGKVVFCPSLVIVVSGRAYKTDPLCINHVADYLSQLLLKKRLLPSIVKSQLRVRLRFES